jgi:AcrR family transcriptional regulator
MDSVKYTLIESIYTCYTRVVAAERAHEIAPRYHSPLRAKQAAETRQTIIRAATTLFRKRGWTATTLPMIATEAGVSVDTIYSTFGTKSALMMAVVDVAIVGDDEEAAMVERPEFALFAKGKRIERLRTGVRFTIGVYQRSVPILKALQEAAASDDAARARLAQYDEDRRDVTAAGLALILGDEAPEEVVDAIWALASPEVYIYLTEGRGWSVAATEAWLVEMSSAAIRSTSRWMNRLGAG